MEMTIAREEGDVTQETVESWKRSTKLPEVIHHQTCRTQMKLGLLGRRCLKNPYHRKANVEVEGKIQCLDYSSFLCECSQRKREPMLIGKNKKPRCFAKLNDISHPGGAYCFSNDKAWMDTEIMIDIPKNLNSCMKRGKRNIIMFLDNAPCHPQTLTGMFSNRRIEFLPKNVTSCTQPLDARIIKSWKIKCCLSRSFRGELETSHKGWLEA